MLLIKKLLYLFVFLCCTLQVQAQNIVLNGSFEAYTTCPTVLGQVTNCLGWWPYTSGSSDYFNCSLVPSYPFFGTQAAANGSGYVGGFAAMTDTQTVNTYKEYIAGTLTTPMVVGATYQVSMSVNLADQSNFGTDDIGMFFFKDGPTSYTSLTSVPPVMPKVTFTSYGPIVNTVSWVMLTGSFFADSAYDKIVIGSWKQAANSNHLPTNSNGGGFAYYYYDAVVVSVASKISTSYSDSLLCKGATMTVPYTVHLSGYFQNNNVFTLQLSNAAGSFANPTILATQSGTTSGSFTLNVPNVAAGSGYRLRVVSNSPAEVSNESLKSISIGNTVPAKPVITATNQCSGQTMNLFCIGTLDATYKWSGPGNFTSHVQNPVINNVTMGSSGNYMVTAWLYGCSARDTEAIVVKTSPAAITASSNSPVCNDATLTLTASGGTIGATYNWVGPGTFTANTKNTSISNISFPEAGNYIISATLNDCTVKDTVSVTVLTTPVNASAAANTPVCEGQNLNLTATNSTPGVSYSWIGPGTFNSTLQNPVVANVALSDAGDYVVELNINGCTVKDTVAVVVKPAPGTPVANSNSPVCNGNTLNLYGGGSLPGSVYYWTGPSFASSQQNPVISNAHPGMAGNYTVIANFNGCTSIPVNTNVTVLYFPASVTAYALPGDTICTGSSLQMIAVGSNAGSSPQFQWLKNGFLLSGANTISYTTSNVADKDKFRVIMIPDNTCPTPDTSAETEITVLPWVTPSVSITASPGTLISPWQMVTFKATPVNGGKNPTYQWKRNGQNVTGAINDIWGAYTLSNDDTISVEMYSSEYCPSPTTATSNSIIINLKLGVDDVSEGKMWAVYPNPNNGTFTIQHKATNTDMVKLVVANAIGQVVHTETLETSSNKPIQLGSHLHNGIYLLRIYTGTESLTVKMTLQR